MEDGENKPQRLEDETASYLMQIETSLDGLDEESEGEAVSLLVGNVLDEIRARTASAAADRRTNAIIEKLVYFSTLNQCMELARRLGPYVLFLAQNRHSSHVVQSLCARISYLARNTQHNPGEHDTPLSSKEGDELRKLFEPVLIADFVQLVQDSNGTHVVRAMLCVCAGVPVVAEKRGKNAKHGHSVSLAEPLDQVLDKETLCVNHVHSFAPPEVLMACLRRSLEHLMSQSEATLQELTCNAASAAVFNLLLRVIFNERLVPSGPELGSALVQRMLRWAPAPTHDNEEGVEMVYQISGNKSGSFFLEGVLDCAPAAFVVDIIRRGIADRPCTVRDGPNTAVEFALDSSANYVLQACLRRLQREVTTVTECTKDARKTSRLLLKELLASAPNTDDADALTTGTTCSHVSKMCGTRGGVVLSMLSLVGALEATSNSSGSKGIAGRLSHEVVRTWLEVQASGTTSENATDALGPEEKVTLLQGYFTRRMQPLLPEKTKGKAKGKGKGKGDGDEVGQSSGPVGVNINSQILLGRLMGAVVALGKAGSETMREACTVAGAISRLETTTVAYMCCNGALSKSCMDNIFDLISVAPDSIDLNDIVLTILAKMATAMERIGSDRVGQHCVRRAFQSCGTRGKEILSSACAERDVMDRLKRSQEGRNTLGNVHAEVYARGHEDFHRLLKRQQDASSMLTELEGIGRERMATAVPASIMSIKSTLVANGAGLADWSKFASGGRGDSCNTDEGHGAEQAGKKEKNESDGQKMKKKKPKKEEAWMTMSTEERRKCSSESRKRKAMATSEGANMHLVRSLNSSKLGSAAMLLDQIEASAKKR